MPFRIGKPLIWVTVARMYMVRRLATAFVQTIARMIFVVVTIRGDGRGTSAAIFTAFFRGGVGRRVGRCRAFL